MPQRRETRFPSGHPAVDGHFPGNPIIPGALLLDEVVKAVAGGAGAAAPYEIRSAKFFQAVRPGDRLIITWDDTADGETRFDCRLPDRDLLVLTGSLRLPR